MARNAMSREAAGQFIEHLRSVHFALVATCFALLVAASLKPPGVVEKAYGQVLTAAGLTDKVFTLETLDAFSRKKHTPFLVDEENYQVLAEGRDLASRIDTALPTLFGVDAARLDHGGWQWDAAIKSNGNLWPVRHWREPEINLTLGDFRKAWDFYATAKALRVDGEPDWPDARYFQLGQNVAPEIARASAARLSQRSELGVDELRLGLREERDARRQFHARGMS